MARALIVRRTGLGISLTKDFAGVALGAFLLAGVAGAAQTPLALVPVDSAKDGGVKVAGAIEVSNGHAVIGSSGSVTAGDRTAGILLPGKGELRVCATTTVHLSRDRSVSTVSPPPSSTSAGSVPAKTQGVAGGAIQSGPAAQPMAAQATGALMMALDRGALEASFGTGKYSDVLMTPDFRILISGPGLADVRVRVSPQGDTCVENRGDHAPYVTVSSQLEDGVYRVQPNQRVLFEHGSLREVVDHESEPCGCPAPPLSIASAGVGRVGDVSGKAASFPLAESEGLAPVPAPTAQMGVAAGETQTQVTVPLAYNGAAPPPVAANESGGTRTGQTGEAGTGKGNAIATASKADTGSAPAVNGTARVESSGTLDAGVAAPYNSPEPAAQAGPSKEEAAAPRKGVFHRIGRFFSRLFGR